jgi:glycosyltransferase involved in cell wall biosynthesis
VHASTIEQWGLVVNEAMACGLPVLVSDHCGCAPDLVVPGKNGFTFSPLDIPALSGLFGYLAGKECDLAAMGAASRVLIARWSPATFAANLKSAVGVAMKTPCHRGALFNQLILQALLQS